MASGKFIKLVVNQVVQTTYGTHWNSASKKRINPNTTWNENDTYISIFGNAQQDELTFLKKSKKFNILFESKKAYNRNMGAYLGPRNTVVVYELK